jgi:putative transposase
MARVCAKHRQQAFAFRTWGGARQGAGRKAARANVGLQSHVARPEFVARVPAHITMRAMRGVPRMRAQSVALVIHGEIARASVKGLRVLDFSVQDDHLHLIVEADDAESLSRGMQRVASRIAMAVNALASRRGKFWRERYHRRDLTTPRQFRNARIYVVMNFRKHARPGDRMARARVLDGMSSAKWIDDWKDETFAAYVRGERARAGPRPTAMPRTWIARIGWKRHGLIDPREQPKSPG